MKMNKCYALFGVGLLALGVTGCAALQRAEDRDNLVRFTYGPGQEAEIERIITNPDGVAGGFYNLLCQSLRRATPPPAGSNKETNQEVLVKTLLRLVKEKKIKPIDQTYVLAGIIEYEYNGIQGTEEQRLLSEPSERTLECINLWPSTKKSLGYELFDHASIPALMEAVKAGKAEITEDRLKLQIAVLQDNPRAIGFQGLRKVKMGDDDWSWKKQNAYQEDQAILKTFNNEKNSPRGIALREALFEGKDVKLLMVLLGSDEAIRNYLKQVMPYHFTATEQALLVHLLGPNDEHFVNVEKWCETVFSEVDKAYNSGKLQRDKHAVVRQNNNACRAFLFDRYVIRMTDEELLACYKHPNTRYARYSNNVDEHRQRILKIQSKNLILGILQAAMDDRSNSMNIPYDVLEKSLQSLPDWVWQDEELVVKIAQFYSVRRYDIYSPTGYNDKLLSAILSIKDPNLKNKALLSIKDCFSINSRPSVYFGNWENVKALLETLPFSEALIREYLKDDYFANWDRATLFLDQLSIPAMVTEGTALRKRIRTISRNVVGRNVLQERINARFDALPSVEEKIKVIDAITQDSYASALISRLFSKDSRDQYFISEEDQTRLKTRYRQIYEAALQRSDAAELSGTSLVIGHGYIGQSEDDLWVVGPNCSYEFDENLNITTLTFRDKNLKDVLGADSPREFAQKIVNSYDVDGGYMPLASKQYGVRILFWGDDGVAIEKL